MRVIAGRLKGRAIPFDNRRYGGAETSPQRLKGALFSMLGEDLSGKAFLDLYACSGQMGIEAYSRNARPVVMNERDGRRYEHLIGLVGAWGLADGCLTMRMDAAQCVRHCAERGMRFECVFIDPPYAKNAGEASVYGEILGFLDEAAVLAPGGRIVVQHFARNTLPDNVRRLRMIDSRKYGTSALSSYLPDR